MIKTKRLLLRPWTKKDFIPFAEMNADPQVREFFSSILSQNESDVLAEEIMSGIEKFGWGLWAVTIPGIADFIGFIGLYTVPYQAHFTPAVEIGWRLARPFWGHGYATEGANASLEYGFNTLNLEEIVSITTVSNLRSQKVMQKIGMHCSRDDDFDHPKLEQGHPLLRHVLYRLKMEEWQQNQQHI